MHLCCGRRYQTVHGHCFAGRLEVVQLWIGVLPFAKFGFTGMIRGFSDLQIRGLQEVPRERLLFETDGPYFPAGNFPVSTPHTLQVANENVPWECVHPTC